MPSPRTSIPSEITASDIEAVTKRFAALHAAGAFVLPGCPEVAPGDLLPVLDAQGGLHAWLAPFVDAGRLPAYALLTPQLVLQRFSLFAGGRLDAAPAAADWLDPASIAARAEAAAGEGARAETPVLSFDGVPDRLAWRVALAFPDGRRQTWFVAGSTVWPAADAAETEYRGS